MTKKTVGYLFIVLAIFLSIAIVAQLSTLVNLCVVVIIACRGVSDSYETARVVGQFIGWLAQFLLIILLFSKGFKFIRNKTSTVK